MTEDKSCRFVDLLLRLALLVLGVPSCLLGLITSNSADNRVLVTGGPVRNALRVSLGLGSLVLALPLNVLLFARLRPGLHASQVADCLDGGALDGVELTSGLAWLWGRHIYDESMSD